ncbi:hypothetical protein DFH06DRAFT_1199220 [Mycena polygramma]|nr:hypothetical protein DFH06DRAFT_1199220 [Mycena polygramma]
MSNSTNPGANDFLVPNSAANLQVSSDRKLPSELERKIFELAAHSYPYPNLLNLMRVAWRVWTWLEPLFYRVICLDGEHSALVEGLPRFTNAALLCLIDGRREVLLANTRHLIIQDPDDGSHLRGLSTIMAACTGVTHLFLHINTRQLEPDELKALSDMPALRVLGIHVSKLCRPRDLRFSHPVFRNITHLEVLDTEHRSVPWWKLGEIPNLTHLAFSEIQACPRLVDVLGLRAPLLDALIFLCHEPDHGASIMVASLRIQPWFVTVKLPVSSNVDWQRGGLTGIDYWGAADSLIAKRRAGTVPLKQYTILMHEP